MIAASRITWLARRLSRIYPAEVPFRIHGVLRSLWQSRGFGDAGTVPAQDADARAGRPWVAASGAPAGIDRAAVLHRADGLIAGRLQVFDGNVPFVDGAPDWNRDPVSGVTIPLRFGLFIDFRHIPGLDIKHLWEVNRLCWWVPVAQAYALTHDRRYLDALRRWLRSWLDACPYPLGANWSSPVEHGIRLINWSLVWHLIGGATSPLFAGSSGAALKQDWLEAIYRHLRFASDNYSFYSSADNHLIGEAAGVFVAAQTWPLWPQARRMGDEAKRILEREALLQFASDGVNREQAFCYHKFSLEFLLASALSARANGESFSPAFWQRVESAIVCIASMMDCRGNVPAIGDADDAAVFELAHGEAADPYQALLLIGARLFGRDDLQRKIDSLPQRPLEDAALWLFDVAPAARSANGRDQALPRKFDDGGYIVAGDRLDSADEVRLVFDIGPLGYNRIGGHAHADALSLLLTWGGVPMLVDAGTYCYNAAPEMRRYFRGTSAHNTLEVDAVEQSLYGGSFLWLRDFSTALETFDDNGSRLVMQARHEGYRHLRSPVDHRRRVEFDRRARCIVVTDSLAATRSKGAAHDAAHQVAAHWHLDAGCRVEAQGRAFLVEHQGRRLTIEVSGAEASTTLVVGQASPPQGWVSRRFYAKQAAPVLRAAATLKPGESLVTTISLMASCAP